MAKVCDGQVVYASQKGVARLRELQAEASIASKPAGASTPTPITERQNIVLTDAALAKFSAGDPAWKTDTVTLEATNAQVNAMGTAQFAKRAEAITAALPPKARTKAKGCLD